MVMSKTDNGTSILTLHIAKALQRDEGQWKIKVTSSGTYEARNLSLNVIPRLGLVMEPMFDFSVEEGEQLTIQCTIQNPESLVNIENGSLVLTKEGINLTPSSSTQLSMTWYKGTSMVDDSGVYTCLYTTYPDPVSVSVYATVIAQDQKRCKSEYSEGILWNTTLASTTKEEPCPSYQKGIATRKCNLEGVWETPNLINCTTETFLNASSQLDTILEDGITDPEKTSKTIDNTLQVMNNLTSSTPELSAGDLRSSIDILEKIVNVTNSSRTNIAKEVFFSVVDNVLSSNNSKSWNAVSEQTEKDASSLLKNIDRLSEVVIQNDNISATRFTGSNFELTINKTKIDETGIRFPEINSKNVSKESDVFSTFFELEKQERRVDKAMSYVAVIYKNIADILPTSSERPDDTEESSQRKAFVNSRVLSLSTQANIGPLNPPLNLTFQNIQTNNLPGMLTLCVSWNFTINKWSEQGCKLVKRDTKETVCECNHLTNFAILMRPYSEKSEDEQSLKTMSLVGVILSIVFVVMTFIIYILTWRFIKSDQNIMMLNLCASLVLAYVVFITSVEQTDNEGLCVAITAVLHYLFLVTFFNMLGMGIYYFMSITVTYYAMYVANNFKSKSRIHWFLVGTWGIPLGIVMIGLGCFWGERYHLRFYCWLSTESGSLYMFIVPVFLIAAANVIIIVSLVRVLCATSAMANSSMQKKAATGLRSLCTLLPVLGVTWLFGILAVNEKTYAFQYIFVLANSLQGIFIFVSHVLLNKKVMVGLRNKYPVLNTLVSFVESSKEEGNSVSKTHSSTEPISPLQNTKIRAELEKYFKRNGKRNKVQKSESFLTEKTISTDCILNDDTENDGKLSKNGSDTNKIQLIAEEDTPKKRFELSFNINPLKKKYTVTGM
ncbi:adhesion G protein-coupled receptor B1-like isoform X2 [Crassostrea virginica]